MCSETEHIIKKNFLAKNRKKVDQMEKEKHIKVTEGGLMFLIYDKLNLYKKNRYIFQILDPFLN